MGLPELTFSLRAAADTVADRISRGVVALILRDSAGQGLHEIHRESDIPADLSEANAAYIRRALIGYINKPEVVYAAVVATGTNSIQNGFAALSAVSYDYLAGPPDITPEEATTLAGLVKDARELRYVGKVVLPDTEGDDAGVINLSASGIKIGSETMTLAQMCSRFAGVFAGTPASGSATYAPLPEVTEVDAVADPDAAIDAGKLILINDGRQIKLGRAVTSKVTFADGEPKALGKIKLVAALDLIRYHAISTVEDHYLGKCANSYDNKCILLSAFAEFLDELEANDILVRDSGHAELDAEAIREYLLDPTVTPDADERKRISALSDDALRREDTGSHVFLLITGRVLDAMEDFHIVLEAE